MSAMKCGVTVVVALSCALAPAAGDGNDAVAALTKLELDWANAVERNDVDAIGGFLHPDFTFTSPKGDIAGRTSHLADFRNGIGRFPLVALSDVRVRIYGPMAVVTSRPTITGTVKVDGKIIPLRYQAALWTDTLVLQGGKWACVARQQSNLSPPPTSANVLLEQLLSEKLGGKEAKLTVVELEYAPGASTPPHHHAGPVVVYVLDGAIESQVEGGPLTTYRRGDVFFEPAGGKHMVSRNASAVVPARFLAYFLAGKNDELTILEPAGRRTAAPEYAPDGNLKLPREFERWVFVGSNIGLKYRTDLADSTPREKQRHAGTKNGDFHNVYINPEAYEHYLATGKFPDKTVLVMDVYEAKEKDSGGIVREGLFPGERRNIEVAVKNSKRPDGSKTDWAYYAFPDPARPTPVGAFKDADCYDCHKRHASNESRLRVSGWP